MITVNGQAPFLSVFMYLGETNEYKKELAMLIEEFLKQRIVGIKNETGVYITQEFPKLLYVLEEDNIKEDSKYFYLTELAAKCTAKRMTPDYISEKVMLKLKGDCYPCMGCVDGKEIITYKYLNNLYVESFERMWNRLSDNFIVKHQYSSDNPNLFMNVSNVEIYDTEKGFVNTERMIRNISNHWVDVHLSNGRRLQCTSDHPFEIIGKGVVKAEDLNCEDTVLINSNQYSEDKLFFDNEKAWLLGFLLCDGCYSNGHICASIAISGEDDIQEKFIKSVKSSFGLDVKVVEQHRNKKGNYKDLYIISDKSNQLQKMIQYLIAKFGGINKNNRHIPNDVFHWTYDARLSFLSGMIDADGYINRNNYSSIQIGSTNKELALQQMALAQSLDMPSKLYYNKYNSNYKDKIRYRIEFYPIDDLLERIVCEKKLKNYVGVPNPYFKTNAKVISVNKIEKSDYSYDVTTESNHFEVSGIYSHNCRSFLTPDRFTDMEIGNIANALNYKKDEHKYYGRLNQGVVTINLPDVALSSGGNFEEFWNLLHKRLELCHKALRFRHERLLSTPSDVAPILWQHGAFARLKKGERIDKLLLHGYSTISLGYAGLYECVKYMTKESHSSGKGKEFGLLVMKALNDACAEWKKAEDIDYSVYGTPIESTTYKFAKCLKNRFGIIKDITDHDYITNSYHINVREEIDPFEKLTIESEYQELSSGGAISYIETSDLTNNSEAIITVMQYIYDHIMYAELNTKSDYCQICGYDGEIKIRDVNGKLEWECPKCGNRDQNKMNVARRTCGYVGSHFWNAGRTEEIRDRFVHLDNIELEDELVKTGGILS